MLRAQGVEDQKKTAKMSMKRVAYLYFVLPNSSNASLFYTIKNCIKKSKRIP
jgi:hypothetical protein